MAMKTLTLLFFLFLITISVSLSTPVVPRGQGGDDSGRICHGDNGFTADLIHRDSPLSPLFNPTISRSDTLRNAFLRSISRASRFSKMAGITSKIDADIFGVPGEYIMQIWIGTPPVEVVGIVDTGSDLTWAQCQPCKNCYKQVGPPFLDPSNSSSYQTLSCQSKACQALGNYESSCDSKNICQYKLIYGDESHTTGDLAIDTFLVGETHLRNIVFGCGHDNNGTFNDNVSGIIGLGGGPLSLINQVNSLVQGKFSYCLIPQSNYTNNMSSKIHFGDHVNISGPNVVSTPLTKKYPSTFYYLTLEKVFVGNKNLSYTQTSSKINVEAGNIIIDSGTTLTIIPQDLYDDLSRGLTDAMGDATVQDPQGVSELCYKDLDLGRVPRVTFRFWGADVELSPENMFWEENGLSCLTIVPTQNLGIFGNLLQRNLMVGYDLVNQKVSFMPTDCTMH